MSEHKFVLKGDMSSDEGRIMTIVGAIDQVMTMFEKAQLSFRGDFMMAFYAAIAYTARQCYKQPYDKKAIAADVAKYTEKFLTYWEIKERES